MNLSMSYLSLFGAACLPIAVAVILTLIEKFTKFSKLNYWVRQVIYGIIFGFLAIAGTHLGIPFAEAQANVRDAPVIISGLLFGGPSGIIAGLIGGIERHAGVYWFGLNSATQIACSVATLVAGVSSALLRKFMYKNKTAGLVSGTFLALMIEIFHLLMVFMTMPQNLELAYKAVHSCFIPMLIGNGLAVLLSIIFVRLLRNGKKAFFANNRRQLLAKFEINLGILVSICCLLSTTFIFIYENEISKNRTNDTLNYAISDIANDIDSRVDNNMLNTTKVIRDVVESDFVGTNLTTLAALYQVTEINLVNSLGYIYNSNVPEYIGFDISKGEQSSEFLPLCNHHQKELVQDYGPISLNPEISRKYAGVIFNKYNGFIQIGYDGGTLFEKTADDVVGISKHRHVGKEGGVIIAGFSGTVSSAPEGFDPIDTINIVDDIHNHAPGHTYVYDASTDKMYIRYEFVEGYYIISFIPTFEADLSRNIALYVNTFLEIIIYGLVFILIYFLIDIIANKRLNKINKSLYLITKGNLDEVVELSSTTEFAELATGINSTVDTLKKYIEAEKQRIDKELAFAKSIQANALPSNFPAFPNRHEFDIYASMDPAKEVGGDFYDFYITGHNHIIFNINDVSGKGIPAALFMMRAKAELKGHTESGIQMNEAYEKTNNVLCDGNDAGMFVTSWQARVNLKTGHIKYVNAGHNPPLIKRADGQFTYLHSKPNLVLAMMEGVPYHLEETYLNPGDILFLYTDGVTESINKDVEQYGEQRLLDILNSKTFTSSKEICETVKKDLEKFVGKTDQFDDITMVAFIFNGDKKEA